MDPQNNQNHNEQPSDKAVETHIPPQSMPPHAVANNTTIMAVFSYLGPLVIVSYLANKGDEFIKFHVKQGLVVFGIEVVIWILGSMLWFLGVLLHIINLGTLILSIIGIINAVQGKKKELPLIGGFAKNFSI